MKIGHKSRRGRKRSPQPHKDHRKRPPYSRVSRLLKARWREAFAPTVEDFDRERLGISEREVQSEIRPRRTLLVMSGATGFSHTNSARGAVTPGRATTKEQ
jgi:hypothetical protein